MHEHNCLGPLLQQISRQVQSVQGVCAWESPPLYLPSSNDAWRKREREVVYKHHSIRIRLRGRVDHGALSIRSIDLPAPAFQLILLYTGYFMPSTFKLLHVGSLLAHRLSEIIDRRKRHFVLKGLDA